MLDFLQKKVDISSKILNLTVPYNEMIKVNRIDEDLTEFGIIKDYI